jgi:RNA polymerase sigma-70 factor (ECF subfamily)
LTDKDIILKIKNGEIDYFSFIVKKFTPSIYGLISKKISKKEDVEDLVQNIFISFYKAIERFDTNKPIKPYLYRIVQNELKMFYRSRKITFSLNEEAFINENTLLVNDDYKNYLNILSNQQKKIFIYIMEGYGYEEISKKIKKPVNTIKSIVRRARIKIKDIYEQTRG